MHKDFDNWQERKKVAQAVQVRPMFKECEIWWCGLGVNVGDEQDGKGENFTRPVLILKKFNRSICLAIPLSTKLKEHDFYCEVNFKGAKQSALLLQIRVVDAKRFHKKMGEITGNEMKRIKDRINSIILN